MRIGCLLVPDLPWVAELRARPELRGAPVAVASEPGPRASLLSVSPEAFAAGVRVGASLAQARSVCAELRVRVHSPAIDRAARQALCDVALSVSPRIEPTPAAAGLHAAEAAVLLDATGVGALFGSESGWATALVARAERIGLPGVAAVASSRFTARLVARELAQRSEPGGVQVVAARDEPARLARLPVDLLDPDDELADALTRFGIHRLGQLLELPRHTLLTRLGRRAQRWVARVRGEESDPPLPAPLSHRLVEEMDLEAPLDRLEPLAFVLRGMLGRLLDRLAVRSLACSDLELTLELAGGRCDHRRLALAAPTREARVLLRRIRLALEGAPPSAAVESVALSTEGSSPRTDQLDLFRPAGPSPAALDALLAELEGLCGPGRIGAPEVPDTHRPDAFAVRPFTGLTRRHPRPPPEDEALLAPTLAVRSLRPPVAAQVRTRAGRPVWVRSALANGEVVRCSGPWRTSGDWWSPEAAFAFDHFDALTGDGLLVRLRLDHRRRCWEIDAVYD